MKICFNDMVYAFSYALDCVEHDLIGVTTHHSQRVSYLSILIGKAFELKKEALLDLAACAALHDNALTEYIQNEYKNGKDVLNKNIAIDTGAHCVMGESNIAKATFFGDVKGAVLYHHENADGSGPFKKRAAETPLYAQIIHLADQVDARFDLSVIDNQKYEQVLSWLMEERNKEFSSECVRAFIKNVSFERLQIINKENMDLILREILPLEKREYTGRQLMDFSSLYANIVDYKSKFTRTHSIGIAEKCMIMARFYQYPEEKQAMLYFAGAVHDIGKLVVNRDILEKPDKLTNEEYAHIKNHAYYTYEILRKIDGLGDMVWWACLHHEKLNGKGYPFGKSAEELNQEERLLACLDIYQALTEKRPYKEGMPHEKAMSILKEMANKGELDGKILGDIDCVFGQENFFATSNS